MLHSKESSRLYAKLTTKVTESWSHDYWNLTDTLRAREGGERRDWEGFVRAASTPSGQKRGIRQVTPRASYMSPAVWKTQQTGVWLQPGKCWGGQKYWSAALREWHCVAAACVHPAGSGFVQWKRCEFSWAAVGVSCLKSVPVPQPLDFLWSVSWRLGRQAFICLLTEHSLYLS